MNTEETLIYRLKKRAEIRRQISTRKSVQEGAPDRIADLLEEAAKEIEFLTGLVEDQKRVITLFKKDCEEEGVTEILKALDSKQAKIDSLMVRYCPHALTEEQRTRYVDSIKVLKMKESMLGLNPDKMYIDEYYTHW